MDEFLAILLAYPTVVWTVLVGVCLTFWAFVIVGAADFDSVGGKAEGAVKGAIEGAAGAAKGGVEAVVKGGVEAAVKGGMEAAVKGGVEAAVKGVGHAVADAGVEAVKGSLESVKGAVDPSADVDAPSPLTELLGMLRLDRAPVTITASFFSLFGWLLSFIGSYLVGGGALVGSGIFAGSAIASLLLTSLAIRPFGVIFDESTRKGGHAMIGKSCVIRSGEVDERGGQAEIEERGASLVVDVRTAQGAAALAKGVEAVVVEYDEEADCYIVAPMPSLDGPALPSRDELVSRPVAALEQPATAAITQAKQEKESA